MLWPKRIVYLVLALLLVWCGGKLGLSRLHSLLMPLGLVIVELALQWAASRRRPAFEQELARLSAVAPPQAVLDFIRGQRLLSFVTPGYCRGKLANVHRQLGQHRLAAESFRLALEEKKAGPESLPLALGLADSLYELGEDAEAERVYRAALDEEHAPPRACLHLSRLIRRRGGALEEAEAFLRRAVEQAPELSSRCELAALLCERNKVDEADWELQLCQEALAGQQPDSATQQQLTQVRRAIEQARSHPVPDPEPAPSRRGERS